MDTEKKENITINEIWLEEQKKMVGRITEYFNQNGELPWNSDEWLNIPAQQSLRKLLELQTEVATIKYIGPAEYSDFNQMSLSLAAMEKGYKDNRWVTYNFVGKKGGYVYRGQRGMKIFNTAAAADSEKKDILHQPIKRFYTVFNLEQIGNIIKTPIQNSNSDMQISILDEIIAKKPELQAEIEANKTPKDKYAYAEILHNLGRGDEISAKPGLTITKDSSPEEIRKEIVAEISSAFLKQTFKSNVSENERPNKLDPKIAIEYLKAHPEEMGAICKDAEVNRHNAITYLKTIRKELTEAKTQEQEQIQQPEIKKERIVIKKKEKKGMER